MTILTDRGKRKGAHQRAHADRKSAERGSGLTQRDSKSVLQFAPNFTVYVLPPEDVCLYSEDRKFFLRGTLYVALASAIGAGKSARQLYRELEPKIPADKIDEALKRLMERRFVVPAARAFTDHAAAYWASLGLPPEAAESLQSCRVRIQSLDVAGAPELGAALKALGVQVVKGQKAEADLTVTLVNDYLEPRLGELNRQHLADRTPWVLVQPSGVFPLVGPVLNPGKVKNQSACWMCLAERMVRNREVKGFLDRSVALKHAARVAASPLARDPLGPGPIALAAVEIAKAIATDFRTDLSDHIVSLDLPGSTVARHYVAHRPQCPACGRKKLRDPRRAAEPFELRPGGKLVMTSGGYRSVSSRATVERNRKHVSPLTGVVSKLERIDVDLPLNTNYFAVHNFSPPAQSVEMLKSGLNGGSYGKGSTAEQGEASALMEAIERYSGIFAGDEVRAPARFTDFAPGDAILPNDVLMFSDAQIRGDSVLDALGSARKTHRHAPPTATPFDRSAEVEWSPVWSLRDQKFRYIPTSVLYFFYAHPSGYYVPADSNGCAAGNTREEAIIQGFLELVERDSYAIWWYNRLQRPEVDLGQFNDPYIHDLKAQLAETGRRLWVLDVTSDLGIPTYVTIAHWADEEREYIEFGSGSHFDPRIAALRAMTELSQFIAIGLMGARYPVLESDDGNSGPFRLQDHPYLTPSGSASVRPDFASTFGSLDTREQVMACVNLVNREGLDFLVLDQTRPDIEVPVVRVTVPGMRHFYRRFAPGRLYDVPVKLRWRDRPIAESDVNPLHPMT